MASKSTLSPKQRGIHAEDYVKKYFIAREFKILSERIKIHGVEVDLVVEGDKSIFLLEIKSLSSDWAIFERISQKQIQRLKKTLVILRYQYASKIVRGYVVYVRYNNDLEFICMDDII